jgi:rhodanese-related sulfurtransferase
MNRKSILTSVSALVILTSLTGCLSGKSEDMDNRSGNSAVVSLDAESFYEAWEESENALLLDVRTPGEYDEVHIPGSYLIPVQELEQRLDEISQYKDREVFVYCRSGNRSMSAASILRENGFMRIINLAGGIRDWQAAELPVE